MFPTAARRPLRLQPLVFGDIDEEPLKQDIKGVLGDLVVFLPSIRVEGMLDPDLVTRIPGEADVLLPLTTEQIVPSKGLRVDKAFQLEPLKLLDKPIFLWAEGGYYSPWNKAALVYLRLRGAEVYEFLEPSEAVEIARALRTRVRMRGAKVLYFGEITDITGLPQFADIFGSDWNLERLERTWGVTVKQVRIQEIIDLMEKIPAEAVEREYGFWKESIVDMGPASLRELCEVIRLYLAMEHILREQRADAFTINCLGDLLRKRFLPPCLALSRFNDEGIVAGCEGDLNALITMMILRYTTDEPAIMGNLYPFRAERGPGFPPPEIRLSDTRQFFRENRARLTHDVIPLSLAGGKCVLQRYHGTDKGLVPYADLPEGTVTLARLGPTINRLVVTVAQVEKVENTIHCSFSLYLKFKDLKEYIRQSAGVHAVVSYGSHLKTLKRVADSVGIEFVQV